MSRSVLEDSATRRTSEHGQHPDHRDANPSGSATPDCLRPGWFSRLECCVLRRVLQAADNPSLAVQLWDGQTLPSTSQRPLPCLRIRDRSTLWKLAIDPLFQFGEAYADGRLEVESNLGEMLTAIFHCFNHHQRNRSLLNRLIGWCHLPRRNTLSGSRDNVHHHYDLGNDFYRLWLDEQLAYTCAYFPERTCTLEEAQVAKMQHVCRKLRLREGETVLEAGCGWGALALFMARHYGVSVKAFNISRAQVAYARERARREGLSDRVEFVQDDWRNMNKPCDAFVSVGMLEHVGLANYRRLGEVISRCLGASGRGLIHTIGQTSAQPLNPWIERRIFPGAYPPTLAQITQVFEPDDFAVLDVENLRLHYAETLRHWRDRFERSVEAVRTRFGERFVRMWRLYLCGSLAAFESGTLQLFQVLFTRGANNQIPWTRADVYQQPIAEAVLRPSGSGIHSAEDPRRGCI